MEKTQTPLMKKINELVDRIDKLEEFVKESINTVNDNNSKSYDTLNKTLAEQRKEIVKIKNYVNVDKKKKLKAIYKIKSE